MNLHWVALGLGNPKDRYGGTRHNVGSETIEFLLSGLGGGYHFVKGRNFQGIFSGDSLYVVQCCYMNESLLIVQELGGMGFQIDQWCVVHDEMALPVGRLRISNGGSAAGHRGVESICWGLKTKSFPRIRIGVQPCFDMDRSRMKEYVLSGFTDMELPVIRTVIPWAAAAVLSVIGDGIHRAMDRFNCKNAQSMEVDS